jgi:undecaprenyl-diphosphatase
MRLTPGELGLELTTLLALLAVGGFAFVLIGHEIGGAPPRLDVMARDASSSLMVQWLIDVAKVVTDAGSFPVVAALAAIVAVWALLRRRPLDAAALVAGIALSQLASHVAKAAYDRPRPPLSFVHTMLSAYPSGHAIQSVALIACATVLVRGGAGWAARFAAETVALVLAVVVCLTRVYLRAHYLTDVLGGFALGVAIWSAVGIAALVGGSVRHNAAARA